MNSCRALTILAFLLLGSHVSRGDERIWLDAQINGQPVRLAFDSGAESSVLFGKTAARLGLKFSDPPKNMRPRPGEWAPGITEKCKLTIQGQNMTTRFGVIELPKLVKIDVDGLIGWGAVRKSIVNIDAEGLKVTLLTNVPPEAKSWTTIPTTRHGPAILALKLPNQKGPSEIFLDTGMENGAALDRRTWNEWTAKHPNETGTLAAYWMLGTTGVVARQFWADQISIGPLVLNGVPIEESTPVMLSWGSRYRATFGLAAIKRLEIIVDCRHHLAYIRPRQTPPANYEHNRLGAVFVPVDLSDDADFIAHVLDDSPAYEAGIRNGDVLLKIDDTEISKWRADPEAQAEKAFWERPAGTSVELTLKRGDETIKTNVVLREMLLQ